MGAGPGFFTGKDGESNTSDLSTGCISEQSKEILLFDTIIDGHHADYFIHLINYWVRNRMPGELIVVTQQSFQTDFYEFTVQQPGAENVRFVPIPQSEIDAIHGASMLTRSFKEWNLLLKYIYAHQPTHALLMYFDIFQLGLWLGRSAPCPVSGIYFRPDFHYKQNSGFNAQLNGFRKKVTLNGVLHQRSLANVFCLDHSAVEGLQQLSPKAKIWALPDPVERRDVAPAEIAQLRNELQIEPHRQIFLLFGHLDDRKGIEQLLEALKDLPNEQKQAICAVLAGPIQPEFREKIESKIAKLDGIVQIVGIFKEVNRQQIQVFFELSDYVLALYQRHVGMASMVVRAAVSRKPVLASDYGYLGHLVQTEQLGAVTDTTSPAAIRALIQRVLTEKIPYSEANLQKLADRNSDVSFAETIFNPL